MKKTLLVIALCFSLGLMAFAQEKGDTSKRGVKARSKMTKERVEKKTPEEIAKIRTEKLDKTLKFSDEQREEIYAYNLGQAKKHRERSQLEKKRKEEMRQEMKSDRERFNSLLTADQQKILNEKLVEHKGRYIEGKEGRFRGRSDGEYKMRKHLRKNIESGEKDLG